MMTRSVNTEITLDSGRYSVLVKVTAYRRNHAVTVEEVIRRNASTRREKLVQIGLSYDLAHTKGLVLETEEEKKEREEREERHRVAERLRLREQTIKRLQKQWIRKKKMEGRRQRQAEREALRRAALSQASNADRVEIEYSDDTGSEMGDSRRAHINGNGNCNGFQSTRKHRQSSRPPRPSLNTSFARPRPSRHDDQELLQDFEFDSDLDMPDESTSTPDIEQPLPGGPSPPAASSDTNEMMDSPWNAVCVVRLKVFSRDPQLRLQVVRPRADDAGEEAPLDRDDPAVSATQEKLSWLG